MKSKAAVFAPLHFSTVSFPATRRLEMWREVAGQYMPMSDISPIGETGFQLSAKLQCLPGVWIVSGSGSPLDYSVDQKHLPNLEERVIISLFLSGASTIRQLGREIRDSPGAGVVLSGNDPFVLSRYREGSFLSIPVARSRVAELAPNVDAAYGTRIPAESEALQLLSRYARAVSDGKFNTPALADAAGGHIVDLVALAIGASSEAAEESRKRGLAAARLMAVKATISAQARKPDLSIAMVAQLHGLTPRYIHKLFEREGTTFSAFLLDRRLGLAHGRLKELRFATHTVASIAFDCGFNDLSYFNRTFRRAYGATPSEIREILFAKSFCNLNRTRLGMGVRELSDPARCRCAGMRHAAPFVGVKGARAIGVKGARCTLLVCSSSCWPERSLTNTPWWTHTCRTSCRYRCARA